MAKNNKDAKKKDKETDDSQTLRDRLEIIRNRQAEIDKAAKVVADIKEELKAAKDKWEGLVVGLGEFIRGELPLFEENGSTAENTENAEA